jgi:hypothetical protein
VGAISESTTPSGPLGQVWMLGSLIVAARGSAVLATHGGIAVLLLVCPVRMKAVAKQVPRDVMPMASALVRSL